MFEPSKKILEKYADVLINFALGWGKGIKKGDVVYVVASENAKPLYAELRRSIIKSGGHVIAHYLPDNSDRHGIDRDFYLSANDEQLTFFPSKYMRGLIDEIDHMVYILGQTDPHALKSVHPQKIMARGLAIKPFMDWRNEKESRGKFSWTLALYGSEAMAKEAGLTLKEYWNQIIKACFLQEPNPIKKWRSVYKDLQQTINKLNHLKIDKLHIEGPDVDLWITLGQKRQWLGGRGANIPSFEIFTSPDWRGTNGRIKFNQPLYRHGNLIKGIELQFKNGKVVASHAKTNEKFLKQMIATKNADKIGEFSLTDKRFSKIEKFMAETLFDENMGGPNGNTHIALGSSYHDTFTGNPAKATKKTWIELGFNDSSVHTDIISTAPRKVTAILKSGKTKIIYNHGQFSL